MNTAVRKPLNTRADRKGAADSDRSLRSLYDTEDIPVLIRLSDLTPSASSFATKRLRETRTQAEPDQAGDATAKQAQEGAEVGSAKRRRYSRERTSLPAGKRWGSRVWSWLSSRVLIVVLLAAITSLVWFLIQHGGSENRGPSAAAPPNTADHSSHDTAAKSDADTASTMEKDTDLWPGDGQSALESTTVHEPSPVDSRRGTAERDANESGWSPSGRPASADAGAPVRGFPPIATLPPASSEAPRSSDSAPPLADGPRLGWGSAVPQPADASGMTEPVQGWPPQFDNSSALTSAQDGWPPAALGASNAAANAPGSGNTGSDSRSFTIPLPLRTGMREQGTVPMQQNGLSRGGATLNGTIEIPQPRATYDRTGTNLH